MRFKLLVALASTAALAAILVLLSSPEIVSSAAVDSKYLSLDPLILAPGVLPTAQGNIPPDCSTWHELHPAYCGTSHQGGYQDNGDGGVTPCDQIVLDGVTWHIDWVGPTYYLTCLADQSREVWEPNQGTHNPGSPECETWQEVHPDFGVLHHIDFWEDPDGSGSLTPCDNVISGGLVYHIDDIHLDIIVSPPGTPTEPGTWGKIKRTLGRLF